MKSKLLLPNRFKKFGWILLILGLGLGIALHFTSVDFGWMNVKMLSILNEDANGAFSSVSTNFADELAALLLIAGIIFVGYAKEPKEDEAIKQLRSTSLQWAVLVNLIVLAFGILFLHDFQFFKLLAYNMFTSGLFFIGRFNILLHFIYRNFK